MFAQTRETGLTLPLPQALVAAGLSLGQRGWWSKADWNRGLAVLWSYPLLTLYCSTVVEASKFWPLSSHQGGFVFLGQTILPLLRWLACHLSRAYPLPVQVLLGAQRLPPPAQHLPQLVCHELLFQVVVQMAHFSLGLVRSFHLRENRDEFRK